MTLCRAIGFALQESTCGAQDNPQSREFLRKRIVIIGGGIVGLATAYKLLKQQDRFDVHLLEKEHHLGSHQTGNSSGVLHCGLYYKPNSLKARLAVHGIREMVQFCLQHDIPHEICGKLVVATTPMEYDRLLRLEERGHANGLKGLRKLNRFEMQEIEPHTDGVGALHVPEEGIVDYRRVSQVLGQEIKKYGGRIHLGARVLTILPMTSGWTVQCSTGDWTADFLINCSGLHADRLSEVAGEKRDVRIIPFRGDYFKLRPGRSHLVNHLIYPVPDPQFPFLGVHFTRSIHGHIHAGPNAVLAFKREGYLKRDFDLVDTLDTLTFPGWWHFLEKHHQMCLSELKTSLSKARFCRALQKLIPAIEMDDLIPDTSGVRAQAMTMDGNLVQDFSLIRRPHALHLINAPSPAATASLAIASHLIHECDLHS